jgi:NADP-dependent 3-hydroxy acid dehydrogenase YdfG
MSAAPFSVVITGASAGVGRATALRFARDGARIAAIARSQTGLDEVRREIEAAGGEALTFSGDVSDCAALMEAADEVARRWDGIDIWINNAMATMFAPVSRMTSEEYARITSVTYLGYVWGTMAALRHMRAMNRGTIVQVGSALAYRAIPLQSAYCGAKFAVRAFTDALRSELIHDKSGVRLTMVQLPAVNTPQFDWARNRMPGRPRPLPPVFDPEDIAQIIHGAAQEGPREVWVGAPSLKIIVGTMAAPGWLDSYLAKAAYEGQFAANGAAGERDGNLFAAAETGHEMRGRFSRETRPRPTPFDPPLLRAGLAGLVALLCAYAIACTVLLAM